MDEKIATWDTNAAIYAVQKRLDILSEIQEALVGTKFTVTLPSGIKSELEKIIRSEKSSIEEKNNANIALEMIKKWHRDGKLKIEKAEPPLDRWFIKKAKLSGMAIVTYDKKLRGRLKKLGAKIIML
ncbi:MAG: hypothetical protein N3G74_01875 [Candidatus Micrarchaeota archaeon]|nr:hypothetical protein [Candidatus Micrarchaeota archaeon]